MPWWECLHEGFDQNSALLFKNYQIRLLVDLSKGLAVFDYIRPHRLCPHDLSATYYYLRSLSNGWL